MKYEPVIGLEVHVELATKSKMFCGCPADHFGVEPNTHTCPVCLGLPGALPVPNRKAIEWCISLGLALGCEIPLESKFDRKNYFYPDIPKGYQISQYDMPLAKEGFLNIAPVSFPRKRESVIDQKLDPRVPATEPRVNEPEDDNEVKRIRIRRVHLEEDTGKLVHTTINGNRVSLVDFNRSGVALVEIVTEPDIRSAEEAKRVVQKLQQTVRYLGISQADMEKGSMRIEPNISIRQWTGDRGQGIEEELPKYKVEVKNINSFRFAEKAIEYEIERQSAILAKGETPAQETRGFVEGKGMTVGQRSKEEAHDYRYFSEPDIPPMTWISAYINDLKAKIPELADAKYEKFVSTGLPPKYALLSTESPQMATYMEELIDVAKREKIGLTPKTLGDWLFNRAIDINEVLPAKLIAEILEAKKDVAMGGAVFDSTIDEVIAEQPKAVADHKAGKPGAIMFLVGTVMKALGGKADAQAIIALLEKKLK